MIVALLVGVTALSAGIAAAAVAVGDDGAVVVMHDRDDENDGNVMDDEGAMGDEADGSLPDDVVKKATQAALAATGGGDVLAVEGDDGDVGYEVEMRFQGEEIEIELDKDFAVVTRADD